jgi:hypothetical protein
MVYMMKATGMMCSQRCEGMIVGPGTSPQHISSRARLATASAMFQAGPKWRSRKQVWRWEGCCRRLSPLPWGEGGESSEPGEGLLWCLHRIAIERGGDPSPVPRQLVKTPVAGHPLPKGEGHTSDLATRVIWTSLEVVRPFGARFGISSARTPGVQQKMWDTLSPLGGEGRPQPALSPAGAPHRPVQGGPGLRPPEGNRRAVSNTGFGPQAGEGGTPEQIAN